MNITPEQISRLRAIAEADMNGADGKAWDEAVTPEVVIALCRELELSRKYAITMSEVATAAWGGEIPSPLPGHVSSATEIVEMFDHLNCPLCGGSGHIDDCQKIQVRLLQEHVETKVEDERAKDWLASRLAAINCFCPFPVNYHCKFHHLDKCETYDEILRTSCWNRAAREAVEGK